MRDGGRSETISDGETKRADADELHQYVLSVRRNFDHWGLQKKTADRVSGQLFMV